MICRGLSWYIENFIDLTPFALSEHNFALPEYDSRRCYIHVCELFDLDQRDPFCRNISSQTQETLDQMLRRNFPPGRTQASDLCIPN